MAREMGYSIFYPYRGMGVKIQGVPWLWFFQEIERYIFAQLTFSR